MEGRTSSSSCIRDGHLLFPWRQASGHVRPGDDLHLLGSDIIIEDGLPRILHGVQLVGVVVTSRGWLPGEHERCNMGQEERKKNKNKTKRSEQKAHRY